MFQLVIPDLEAYDDGESAFVIIKGSTIQVEHSLVSISKWESKWNKPFLSDKIKTREEIIDYIRCMTLTQNVNSNVYNNLTNDNVSKIRDYISKTMTATWFNEEHSQGNSKEIITSELIYYWMITYNIPFECQKWHLNRLITLIKVCSKKNEKTKKMSKREIMNKNRELNNKRRQQLNSEG